MASAMEFKSWREAERSNARTTWLLLAVLALLLIGLLSQPVAPLALVEEVVEPAAAVVEEALEPLVPVELLSPAIVVDDPFATAATSVDASSGNSAAEESSSSDIPVGVSSWYGTQSPYAGKPLVISGGSAGTHFWK